MTASQLTIGSLGEAFRFAADRSDSFLQDAERRLATADLFPGSVLYGWGDELRDRSVLLAIKDQWTALLCLIELDGVARRIVLCPPDLQAEHLPHLIEMAGVDSIISDRAIAQFGRSGPLAFIPCSGNLVVGRPRSLVEAPRCETEWVLLTSGTTGLPKLVAHTFSSLTAAIQARSRRDAKIVWSTFYDIRRYGGLQILLRAALTGASLLLSRAEEPTRDFLARAAAAGVTHISGTPSHWRRALMSTATHNFRPEYIRLSGEAADQAILDSLRSAFPGSRIVHAFASTEAGVGFEVTDGQAGFSASVLAESANADMKVEDGTLWLRSAGCARCYLGDGAPRLKDLAGFVNTLDVVELHEGRYYFGGRRDGVINVGGLKVHPEQVEAVINRHPDVQMSLVRGKKSPITGALVVAEVVLRTVSSSDDADVTVIQDGILQLCREALPSHKVPAVIKIVPSLALAGSGKVMRRDA